VQRQVEHDHCVELLREDFIWTSGVVMYRRSAVDMVDGFDSRIDACADCDLNIRITRDHPVYGHGQVVLEYRHHDASMSRNAALMLKTAMTALGYQLKYVAGHRRLEEACRAGKKTTKEYFGRRLVKELNGQLHSREWRRMMAGCLTLLRYHPLGMMDVWRTAVLRSSRGNWAGPLSGQGGSNVPRGRP